MAEETTGKVTGLDATKLERVDNLLQSLKDDAQKAYDEGDMFMLAVYNDLLQVCSPIVVKSMARLERETKALHNKRERIMRKQHREAMLAKKKKEPATP